MRQATYYIATTIDGHIADRYGGLGAFLTEGDHDEVLQAEFADTYPTHMHEVLRLRPQNRVVDTVLMGWSTYAPALTAGVPLPYAHLRQYVATRHPRGVDPAITLTRDPLGTLRDLKAEDGGSGIWIAGGGTLAATVIDEIDRIVLKIHPTLIGLGIPAFAPARQLVHSFVPDRARTFRSGLVLVEYSRAS